MHVIQLAPAQWLVLDDVVQPRFLIVEGPMVSKATGETHIVHRVEWWSIDRAQRRVLAVHDGLLAAQAWCRGEFDHAERSRAEVSRSVDITRQASGH